MKKILYIVMGALVIGVSTLTSCDKGFEEINTDPINALQTTPDKLLAPALVNSLSVGMQRNRNFNNELMQVTVALSDGDASVFRYEFRRTFSDYLWNGWYVQLKNFKDIYDLSKKPENLNTSYQGIALICQAWLFANLTDVYGDIPYTQALLGREEIVGPVFDKQKDIYLDLYKKLEEANTSLAAGQSIRAASDPVFAGNVAKWRKFGNSLYLRLLLRTSGKAEVATANIAKIKQIVDTNPAGYPIMANNTENATIKWSGEIGNGPLVNPYVNSVRAQDFRAVPIASFFIDNLRNWQDPRIDNSTANGYAVSGVNRLGIAYGSAGPVGVPSGYSPGTGVTTGQSYFYATDNTISGVSVGARSLQQSPLTGILMNYAELQFILSEAALRGWISGSAEAYYNTGIASSVNYWAPTFPTSTTDPKFLSYITTADIDWVPAFTFEQKMEQIHLQKYYALFLVDLQQWFEFRRTGHPILPKGAGLRNGGVMPARMAYPIVEVTANPTNYKAAVAAQGPDEIYTNVWWQKP